MTAPVKEPVLQRQRLRVTGVVQGVGFRPFVYRLARELGLAGWVRNDGAGVEIEAEGEDEALAAFRRRLREDAPRLARVDELRAQDCAPVRETDFLIVASAGGPTLTAIGHDSAVCPDCLAELFDPADRRYRYAFINCTQCGPRYTLTRGLPYDRALTSMAGFAQCPSCDAEYRDPGHRRFHAEPNACPVCGPRLVLGRQPLEVGAASAAIPPDALGERPIAAEAAPTGFVRLQGDSIAETLARLLRGEIVAIKGLGGFHLACDARNAGAVAKLRARKQREEKPFAVMLANVASAQALAQAAAAEQQLLERAERPIVLLRKEDGCDERLPGVVPGLAWLGVMLPYTPIHYLLFHEAAGRPAGTGWLQAPQALALVMTSANPCGEPLVRDNAEALERLAGIADVFLLHDRDIVARCDDSVVRLAPQAPAAPQFIRRARGFVPRAIKLARAGPPVLALGGWFKNTVVLTRGDEAFVSPHIGDLDNAATCAALEETVNHLQRILAVRPERIAHDLHPDFHSTRLAADYGRALGVPVRAVQHHHAHVAAVLAEHRHDGAALGLALDGVGLGSDGAPWGGELLRVDGARFTRLGHLRPLQLPGGDRAAREPWRMAAAALHALGRGAEIPARFPRQPGAATVAQMLTRGVSSPATSSMGRWFDAAAGLLGLRETMAFEGQAAMLLEGLAEAAGEAAPPPDAWRIGAGGVLDLLPLLQALAGEPDAGRGAALFHAGVAAALADWVARAAQADGLATVALGGGCFLNHILSRSLAQRLAAEGLTVLQAQQVPPNDGGLSLGQAWVALQD